MPTPAEQALFEMVLDWDLAVRDPRDAYPFRALLEELLFHGRLRYDDYKQFRDDGLFPVRLNRWLHNVSNERDRKILLRLLSHLLFIDSVQFIALYRDVYRRIIIPWVIAGRFSPAEHLSSDYELLVRSKLKEYLFVSITESFDGPDFMRVNDLVGLPKFRVLGENREAISAVLPNADGSLRGLIVLEDFVGTGKQAARIVNLVAESVPNSWHILFSPLISLARGERTLRRRLQKRVTFAPVQIVQQGMCLGKSADHREHAEFASFRSLVKQTERRVLEALNEHDDPPADPFGYKGCGALLVTSQNAPNNTLPLLHHRAPSWWPLFRRLHHAKGDL